MLNRTKVERTLQEGGSVQKQKTDDHRARGHDAGVAGVNVAGR